MYISPSQIVETGYSQGDRFVTITNNQLYKGYYHKDNQDRYWTGEEHTNFSILLQDLYPSSIADSDNGLKYDVNNARFTRIYGRERETTPLLKSDFVSPLDSDYENGYFSRYFSQLKDSVHPYILELKSVNNNFYHRYSVNKVFQFCNNIVRFFCR
jgi:hypothetical protein